MAKNEILLQNQLQTWCKSGIRNWILHYFDQIDAAEVSIKSSLDPFYQIQIGTAFKIILHRDQILTEISATHLEPLRRLLELHAFSPHDWFQAENLIKASGYHNLIGSDFLNRLKQSDFFSDDQKTRIIEFIEYHRN